jgi:hypothetical protein
MGKLVARQLAAAALWVRIRTSLKITKWTTQCSPPKQYTKNNLAFFLSVQVKMRAKPVSRKVSQQEEINKRLSLPADLRYRIFIHKTLHFVPSRIILVGTEKKTK